MDEMDTDGMVPSPNTPRGDTTDGSERIAGDEDSKVEGILRQTQADLPEATSERIADVIGQRLHDAGISRTPAQIDQLAARIAGT